MEAIVNPKEIDQHSPSSVRVHGVMLVFHEYPNIGEMRSRSEHDEVWPDGGSFDCIREVEDSSLFRSYEACRDLIQGMLAELPETRQCDLAATNWENYQYQPHDIATEIVDRVRRGRDTEDRSYAFDIEMVLWINNVIHNEPNALLLACKEAAAARVPERGRKRRRREPAGELCAICLSDLLETEEEETVRLPCSHPFHSRCIEPWFHRSSTCPTCRRDAANSTARHDDVIDLPGQ
jgi:hypothetical protein